MERSGDHPVERSFSQIGLALNVNARAGQGRGTGTNRGGVQGFSHLVLNSSAKVIGSGARFSPSISGPRTRLPGTRTETTSTIALRHTPAPRWAACGGCVARPALPVLIACPAIGRPRSVAKTAVASPPSINLLAWLASVPPPAPFRFAPDAHGRETGLAGCFPDRRCSRFQATDLVASHGRVIRRL